MCPHDGTALECIGTVDSEQLDIVPATVRVLHHERRKYACPCCKQHMTTAPMTPQPIPKSQASPGLLAFVATAKYVDALPLYRQTQQFERLGLECSRATLARWMVRCGELVQPLINLLRDELLAARYRPHATRPPCRCSRKPARRRRAPPTSGRSAQALPERPIVLFDYDPTRSGEVPKRLLEGFSGYPAHRRLRRLQRGGRELSSSSACLCMAHARRYFTDALKAKGINPNKLPLKPAKGDRYRHQGARLLQDALHHRTAHPRQAAR